VRRLLIQGEIPSPKTPPSGCRFHTRCPFVEDACKRERQVLVEAAAGHWVACRRWQDLRNTAWPAANREN